MNRGLQVSPIKQLFSLFLFLVWQLTNRKWFSVVFTLIDNDIRHHRGQNHDTKKEQALSITFSQYDWLIFQNRRFWLAITLCDKLTRVWRVQRGLDSYRQRQISQSDCEITSNCVKLGFEPMTLYVKRAATWLKVWKIYDWHHCKVSRERSSVDCYDNILLKKGQTIAKYLWS